LLVEGEDIIAGARWKSLTRAGSMAGRNFSGRLRLFQSVSDQRQQLIQVERLLKTSVSTDSSCLRFGSIIRRYQQNGRWVSQQSFQLTRHRSTVDCR
jgi:hypothetical protein